MARGVTPPARTGSIVRPAIVYALLFGAFGAYIPYIALYLGGRGLDLGAVGALIALFAGVSVVAAPVWGAIADGIGDARGPILLAGILSGFAAVLLAIATDGAVLAIAIALLAAAWAGVVPMVDSRVVRFLGARERFGQARASGSAAFIAAAFIAGALAGRLGTGGQFVAYVPLVVGTGIAAWLLLVSPADRGRPRGEPALGRAAAMAFRALSPSTIGSILSLPRFGLFFVASIVIWTSHAAFQGFISIRVAALGGDPTMIAAAWSLGALVEVPLMLAFPRIARRFGSERLIVVGAFAFAARSFICGLAQTPLEIVAAGAFAGFGFAFVYVGTVTWIAGAASRSVAATAQGIITGTATSIGAIVGSIVGGAIGGAWGLPTLFVVTAAGYGLGGLLVWFAIVRGAAAVAAREP